VDPGIGFGKSAAGNLELIAGIGRLLDLGRPVLVGPSRKSFIGAILDVPVEERLEGTIAACLAALERGARLFRVHDVRQVRRALDVAWAIRNSGTLSRAT
ncbi:MAG: dihydropteroate synthase, partial [Gemmatimonadetes bacterium]|nr:dihydropteroate synthase [Gemmatimonadota bacterium]